VRTGTDEPRRHLFGERRIAFRAQVEQWDQVYLAKLKD
jgi:hypothetical protein